MESSLCKKAAFFALAVAVVTPFKAAAYRGHVYDGDTIGPTFRLTIDGEISFDTPEISRRHGAQCDLEIARGKAARARLRAMIAAAERVEMIPLLDARGAIAQTKDGRGLLRLRLDGTNVGHLLAQDGLAVVYRWRSESVDWCATPPEREARP